MTASGPVASGYALATGEATCEQFHFGLLDLTLKPRPAADVARLRQVLTERFGPPWTFAAGPGRRTDHWQVTELRSVELQYSVRSPGVEAGVAIANIPPDVAARRKAPKREL